MSGEVGILNVGAGDTKLSFDPKNPVERIRAALGEGSIDARSQP